MANTALGGHVTAATVSAAVTAAQAGTADAVLASLDIPGDATVLDVILTVTDMDSNGAPAHAVDVGDTGDDNRFIAAQATNNGATARYSDTADQPVYTYSETGTLPATIEVTNQTAAATGADGTVTLTVIYFRQ